MSSNQNPLMNANRPKPQDAVDLKGLPPIVQTTIKHSGVKLENEAEIRRFADQMLAKPDGSGR